MTMQAGQLRRVLMLLASILFALATSLLLTGTASARSLPAAETRVGVSHPAVTTIVGVAEHIAAGQRLGRAPSQLRLVVGHCVAAEANALDLAKGVLGSDALATLRNAHAAGSAAEVSLGGRPILYEPGLPSSGFTLFQEGGFVLGPEAFASEHELASTLLHESHRLLTSGQAKGIHSGLASSESDAAARFASGHAGRLLDGC